SSRMNRCRLTEGSPLIPASPGTVRVARGLIFASSDQSRGVVDHEALGRLDAQERQALMTKLTHTHSPLEQAHKHQRVSQSRSKRPLSLRDQATLKRLLTEKYEFVANELFELSDE